MKRQAILSIVMISISSVAIAQGAGGVGGASSAAPSGTAGVSPSTANPGIGTPGIPGPSNGVGLPGGSGAGNTVVAPNLPSQPGPNPTVGTGRGSGSTLGSSSSGLSKTQSSTSASRDSLVSTAQFNPGAVIDTSLAQAFQDIRVMSVPEMGEFLGMFNLCTRSGHPMDRQGKCGAASKRYHLTYGKNRPIDQAITELERVVQFQSMFRTTGNGATEYADSINERLQATAAEAMVTSIISEQVTMPRG